MPIDVRPGSELPEIMSDSNVDLVLNPPAPNDEWIRAQYGRIHRAAWMMTGDPWAAEDLAQETFIVAIDRWNRFDGRSSRATWLYGILIRLRRRHDRTLARFRRRLMNYAQRQTEQTEQTVDDPQTCFAQQQWRDGVWAEVAKLPAAQREAITLRFANEMSYDDIASALGCAPGTAKTRVHHGLRKLRELGVREELMMPSSSTDLIQPTRSPSQTF